MNWNQENVLDSENFLRARLGNERQPEPDMPATATGVNCIFEDAIGEEKDVILDLLVGNRLFGHQ